MNPQNEKWKKAFQASDEKMRRRLLEIALDARKQELQFLWQRSQFFWLFNGAIFTAFKLLEDPLAVTVASCFGFVASLSWTLLNRGSKYWYESWEEKLDSDRV
jgi:hypothetical protein